MYLETNDLFEMSAKKVDNDTFLISQFAEFPEVPPLLAAVVTLACA